MTRETPIACSLSAEELPERLAQMRAIGRDALLAVTPEGTLRFSGGASTRQRLEAIIAAESQCCPFVRFELAYDRGELVLSISAPEGAEPVARDLVNAF
jgi:MerR family copper efflux transcriptional regulator